MATFTAHDIRALEAWPASRADVGRKLSATLDASVAVRVKVDAINDLTGEYRIVLQGTLDSFAHRDDRVAAPEGMDRAA